VDRVLLLMRLCKSSKLKLSIKEDQAMGYFPEDTLRRVMMAVFVVLAIVELTRGSWFFVIDVLFALSLSPKILASVIGVFKRKD
jgi:hypothetical protein